MYDSFHSSLSYISTITHLITIVYMLPLHASYKKRAISLQKVHLWMDCGKRILWSWTQSKATKIRAATVQSSVWTLQQILPDVPPYSLHITGFMYPNFLQKHYAIYCIGSQKIGRTKKTCS